MVNPFSYLKEVRVELTNVTWPSRQATFNMTVLVLAVSAILGVYLGLIDFVFSQVITQFI